MIKKATLSLLAAIALSSTTYAQAVYINKNWQSTNGSPLFNPILNPLGIQWSNSITNASGELITLGHTQVAGQGENIWLIKYTASGSIVFQTNYNTNATNNDYGIGLCETSNGDILVCGTTDNSGLTNYDAVILRYNSTGTLLNSVIQAGASGKNDIGIAIREDAQGDIIVAANTENTNTQYDYWVLKYTSGLSLQANNTYDYAGLSEVAIGLEFSTGGDICVIGASPSSTLNTDYAIAVFNPNSLSYISDVRNNIAGTGFDKPLAFCKDGANNIYITGKAWNGTNFNVKTVKINANLSLAWTSTLDVNGLDDVGNSIAIDVGGNVFVGGYETNTNNKTNLICIKYNGNSGAQIWKNYLPSTNPSGNSYIKKLVTKTSGDVYYIAGEKGSGGFEQTLLGKIKSSGERNWMKNISNPNKDVQPSDIEVNSDIIYAITILDPNTASYQITKYSELILDTTSEYKNNKPYRLKNHLLVSFQPSAIIPANINNKELEHGTIADFITPTALANLVEYSNINEIGNYKCYKVFPWMVMDDSMSITRSGRLIKIFPHYTTFGILLPLGTTDSVALKDIADAFSVVSNAQYNRFLYLDANANDPEYSNGNSSGLVTSTTVANANINVEPAWDLSVGDPNIKVGIFDTGINFAHLDFGNGTFVGSKIAKGFDYQANVPLNTTVSNDIWGHGTAVGDKIGALRNNNYAIAGIAGGDGQINHGVTLHDMKIFGIGSNCNFSVTAFALEKDVANAIVQGATNNTITGSGFAQNIQNHSWGGYIMYGEIMKAFITAYQNEVLIAASSGNNATNFTTTCGGYSYPSSYKDHIIMKVGANNNTGGRAIFSECDHRLDFIAPGTHDLYSSLSRTGTTVTDNLVWPPLPTCTSVIDGTSFAAPHAAGTAALLLSYANNTFMPNGLFPEDIEHLMELSAKDLTISPYSPGYDPETGYGRIDAGQTLSNYYFPGYLVQHFTVNVSAASAYSVGNVFENTCLWQQMFNQPFGVAKARRYKLSASNSHTIPAGYTFIKGWELNAASNVMGILTSTAGILSPPINCVTNGLQFEEDRYIPDGTSIIPVSITSTSATFDGYIYEIYDPSTNLPVGWYPFGPTGTAIFAYSIYLKSLMVGLPEENFTENSFIMYPNPTMDKIFIKSRIKELDYIDVEIVSALGQLVIQQHNLYLSETNSIDVSKLNNGIYFVKLTHGKKTIVNKIIVSK